MKPTFDVLDWAVITVIGGLLVGLLAMHLKMPTGRGKTYLGWFLVVTISFIFIAAVQHFWEKFAAPALAGPVSAPSSTQPGGSSVSPVPAPATTANTDTKLQFTSPVEGDTVPRALPVALKGFVPPEDKLWIIVQSSGRYYLQGRADAQGPGRDTWFLSPVTLGTDPSAADSDPGDVKATYTIWGVKASPETDAELSRELPASRDFGLDHVPGGVPDDSAKRSVKRNN